MHLKLKKNFEMLNLNFDKKNIFLPGAVETRNMPEKWKKNKVVKRLFSKQAET